MSDADFIRIDGVTKRFAGLAAVDDANLSIHRGEFFSLLGPSGCGKTTLLRMIAGFEFPTQGEIYVEGVRITDMPAHLRPSNMVFQSYAIFPHLNVFDNIAYGMRRARLGKTELAAQVNAALAMIKLEGFGARRADELSGGQRQRVALARALICRPKVLLLDEPLGALDKRLRESMQIELRQLQKSVGITFVFVTHDQEEALSMSDRIAVMSGGKILQIATPRVLYEEPNCREVADFIGTINFFDAKVTAPDTIDAGPIGTVHATTGNPAGSKILVALRPEKIVLSADPIPGSISGMVVAAAYLGERSHYTIAIPGRDELVAVSGQNAEKIVTKGHAPGDTVYLSWARDAMVVLPCE